MIPSTTSGIRATATPSCAPRKRDWLTNTRSALLPLLHDWALRQGELARGRAIGVHAAVVGIGYNSKALANKRLPEPRCWADLARPEYRNELHFVNPSASRVGYTTLATLVQVFGEERAFELMKAIHRNAGNYAITANGAICRCACRSDDRRRDAA